MLHVHNLLVKRQMPISGTGTVAPTATGVSGGETASGVNPGSSLLLGATGSPTNSGFGLLTTDSGTTSTSSPTPATSSSSSSNGSSPSVSTGSVIAITVAAFLVLVGVMFLIYTYIKRRTALRTRHPVSRGPPPVIRGTEMSRDHGKDKRRDDDDDRGRGEGKNHSPLRVLNPTRVRGKSPDSAKFGLFEKDPSIHSLITDEKANMSEDHHFDPSTMASFTKYQVGPADGLSALSHPHPVANREERSPPVSWDGKTVISDPFASLHASVSDTMSPTAVVVRQTPRTTDVQHRWESAEVLIMDGATTEPMGVHSDTSQNPFSDDSASRRSTGGSDSNSRSNGNPFFNASQHNPFAERSTRSRASSVSTTTAKRSRSYSASSRATVRAAATTPTGAAAEESESALHSLLAALRPTPVVSDEPTYRGSIQSTVSSLYHPAEGEVDRGSPQAL